MGGVGGARVAEVAGAKKFTLMDTEHLTGKGCDATPNLLLCPQGQSPVP